MGYDVSQVDSKFFMSHKNKVKALEALKRTATRKSEMRGGDSNGNKWFSFTDMDYIKDVHLEDALEKFGLAVETNGDNDIISISVEGYKLGQEDIALEAIAPWVKSGSYIEMSGEDGCLWRWTFENKKFAEVEVKISWK